MQNKDGRGLHDWVCTRGAKRLWGVLICGFVLFSAGAAFAHKVYIFAWVEGDQVYTDSYFPDKRKVIRGKVKVLDPEGNLLREGVTDEHGAFSFKVPQKSDLHIVLEAGMGHKGEFILKSEELPGDDTPFVPEPEKSESVVSTQGESKIDLKDLELVIQKALEEKLKPIERKLARLEEEQGPGLTEAIGGIGYILGLMGIVAYFKSRGGNRRTPGA
jgi:nickel transport protein